MASEVTMEFDQSRDGELPRDQVPVKYDACFGRRHLQVLLMFLAQSLAYSLRINLSVAIVAMVDKQDAHPDFPEYDWDPGTQSLILSSFFWGHIVTLLPAGPLCDRFGAKVLLLVAIGGSSLLALLTAVAASWSWQLVCVLRVLQGLCQGVTSPCLISLLASWAPESERGRLTTYTFAGGIAGTMLALTLTGLLSSSPLGWPSAFYLFGACGMLWCILWVLLGSNSPAQDRHISREEREFIESSAGTSTPHHYRGVETGQVYKTKPRTPWWSMMTSPPVWALIAANCAQFWGFWTLLVEMPTFMKTVLHYEIKANGFLSSLPYVGQGISSYLFAWLSDFINRKKLVRPVTSRRVFNTIGHGIPSIVLIGLGFTNQERASVAVWLIVLAVSANGATYVGFTLSHIDLAPNYAGTLMGITNTVANMMSILSPLVVGGLVTDEGDSDQWRTVFLIAAGLLFLLNVVYVVFVSSDVQEWNEEKTTVSIVEDTERET